MKIKKNVLYLVLGILLVLALWYFFFSQPTYDHPFTEKPMLGNPEANISIVEYSDLQCPFCKEAHPTLKTLSSDYGNVVSITFRHFPITTAHPMAFKSAEAAECANDQGKFWQFVDLAFERQKDLSITTLKQIALDLQLDTRSFNACLDSGAKALVVDMEQKKGQGEGVSGTPTFFLNGEKIENWRDYDSLAKKIDSLLGKTKEEPPKTLPIKNTEKTIPEPQKTNDTPLNILQITR